MSSKQDDFIINILPRFIAINYRNAVCSGNKRDGIKYGLRTYRLGVRALAIAMLSQYVRDEDKVINAELNYIIEKGISIANVRTWNTTFFAALDAYKGKPNLFFIRELYDIYWRSSEALIPNHDVKTLFDQFTTHWYTWEWEHGNIRQDDATETGELHTSIMELLRETMRIFLFMENYELIRIRHITAEEYVYDRHKGLELTSCNKPLSDHKLVKNNYYLMRTDHTDCLELHPLIVHVQKKAMVHVGKRPSRNGAPALFDSRAEEIMTYISGTTFAVEEILDEDIVRDFAQLILYALTKWKKPPEVVDKLTWGLLKEKAHLVSTLRMSAVRNKYHKDLYVKRQKIEDAFASFLASDKSGFILTGKSGVGKSNFLLSLLASNPLPQDSKCILMLNGAKIGTDQSLSDTIGSAFNKHLTIRLFKNSDIWEHINTIDSIARRQVILCIDAINENPNPEDLFRQIDELIETSPWPWLKVVVTSRPEVWRSITRKIDLARTRYYYDRETNAFDVVLTQFNPELKIHDFTRNELEIAYGKYSAIFDLQTDFDQLTPQLKEILRDPLALRLIAHMHRGQPLPKSQRMSHLISDYIMHLKQEKILLVDDLVFLENEIVARMVDITASTKGLSSSKVLQSQTSDGHRLRDLIHDNTVINPTAPIFDQKRVNDGYRRLADSEILVQLESDDGFEIGFRYERFYDYFAALRILRLASQHPSGRSEVYKIFIEQLKKSLFLWGPIKTALVTELREGNDDIFLEMALIADGAGRLLITRAVTEFGREDIETTSSLVSRLLASVKRSRRVSRQDLGVYKIVVDIAAELNMGQILVQEARNPSPTVRFYVASGIYHLSRCNEGAEIQVLASIERQLKNRFGIPRRGVIEVLIGASTLIVAKSARESGKLMAMQNVWRNVICQLLFIRNKKEEDASRTWQSKFWNGIVFVLTKVLAGLGKYMPGFSSINIAELENFYRLSTRERQDYERLLPYLDIEHGSIEELESLIFAVAHSRDILTQILVFVVLSRRNKANYFDMKPVTRKLFDSALDTEPPSPMVVAVLNSLYSALSDVGQDYVIDALETMEQYLWRYYERSDGIVTSNVNEYQHFSLDLLLVRTYEITGKIYPKELERYLDKAMQERTFTLHRILVGKYHKNSFNLLISVAALGYPKIALKLAELFVLNVQDEVALEGAYEALAYLRRRDTESVNDMVRDNILSNKHLLNADARTSEQSVGDILAYVFHSIEWGLVDDPEVEKMLQVAPRCASLSQFLNLFVKRAFNLIYGRTLFEVE